MSQNTVSATSHTTVSGSSSSHAEFSSSSSSSQSSSHTEVLAAQTQGLSIHESVTASGSFSESHSSTTIVNGVVVSSDHAERQGDFNYAAQDGHSAGVAHGTTTTIRDGVVTSEASTTTVRDGSATAISSISTGVIGGSAAPCPPQPIAPAPTPAAQPAAPAAPATPAEHVQKQIRDGRLGAHGVNLGSWLVAEQWMCGSEDIWKNVPEGFQGEYQVLVHGADREQRLANFDKHHASFITEQDIAAIAKAGFNMVRVPVGYWLLGGDLDDPGHKSEMEAFPKNTVQWVDKLVREWAVRHNVAVLVDIHAAKGSQNGDQHSAPTTSGTAYWGKYPENVRNTVLLAKFIGDRYKNDDAFLGIGLLNEPAADTDEKVLAQYHQDAYHAVRESGNDCVLSCMPYRYHQDPEHLVGFMEAPAFKNVWIEWHPYFIWGNENKTGDELIKQTILTEFQEKVTKWTTRAGANRLFMSEWSLANTGQFRDPDSPEFADWARAQVKVMNQATAGWAYWSWHLEGDDKEGSFEAWSARSVIRREPLRKILLSAE